MARKRKLTACINTTDRHEAAAKGFTRFYTGIPCKHGHLAERYVSSGGCQECIHPIPRSAGPNAEFWTPNIRLPCAIDGPTRDELWAKLQIWTDYMLREKGLPIAPL